VKIIVTGASGFLARNTIELLENDGHEVLQFDIVSSHDAVTELDITDRELVLESIPSADALINFVGTLGTSELNFSPYSAVNINILGQVNLLDACKRNGTNLFLYPSKPQIWENMYSISKEAVDRISYLYNTNDFDVRGIIVRNAYGKGQAHSHVRKIIPDMILRALRDNRIEIFGSGQQPVDLISTRQIARIFSCTVQEKYWPESSPIESGCTERYTVMQIAKIIIDQIGTDIEIVHLPMREGEDESFPLPPPKPPFASALFGISPEDHFIERLPSVVNYYRELIAK
jgi:UDP-glucose 4-epimerase